MRRTLVVAFAAVLLAAAAPAALAQGKAPAFELTPTAGYWYGDTLSNGTTGIFDFDVTIDDAPSYGVRMGYRLTPAVALELFYAESTADMVTGEDELFGGEQSIGEIDMTVAEIGVEGSFGTSRVVPFIAGGIGAMRLDPRLSGASADTRFAGDFGGGLKLFLAPQLALRFDARLHSVLVGDNDDRNCGDWDEWEDWDCRYNDWLNFVEVAVGLSIVF
jgi:hypothetical protein